MVVGAAPLPFENQKKNYALNNRTWHIGQALMAEGHEVALIGVRVRGAYGENESPESCSQKTIGPGVTYFSVRRDVFGRRFLRRICQDFQPDGLVGVGTVASSFVVQIDTERPIWADLFGSLMAEAQAKASVYDDDFYLRYWRQFEIRTLRRADVFSAVSLPQKHALIGELGLAGRLNKHTLSYDFVRVMPICLDETPCAFRKGLLRDTVAGKDDFVIFWSGGYNTWTDVDTLFDGLVMAMERNARIKFISSGGGIESHDDLTFSRFLRKIRGSRFADRFVFLGWLPTAEVPSCYLESDVGINIDKFSYEALLGARNRLNEMIKAGLPILTTKISEISALVEDQRLGLTFPIGDAGGLAEAILSLADHPDRLREIKERLAAFPLEELSYKKILRPLQEWARQPRPAPDFGKKGPAGGIIVLPRVQFLAREGIRVLKDRGSREAYRQALQWFRGRSGRDR
jgi:glycosyltransferase involved in cell wall biosynthesis